MKLVKQEQSPSSVRQTLKLKPSDIGEPEHHTNLARLNELKPSLSYNGWEEDFKTEEKMHKIFPSIAFEKCLWRLEEKQRMHNRIRTHERLVRLDSVQWSYPGWKADFRQAEEHHVWNRKDTKLSFERIYKEMKQKQRQYRQLRSQARKALQGEERGSLLASSQLSSCIICMFSPRSHVFIPCGHLVACESCSLQAFKKCKACPICRKLSSCVTKVYLS